MRDDFRVHPRINRFSRIGVAVVVGAGILAPAGLSSGLFNSPAPVAFAGLQGAAHTVGAATVQDRTAGGEANTSGQAVVGPGSETAAATGPVDTSHNVEGLDQQLQQERTYPATSIPNGAYPSGVSQYNLVTDHGGSLGWTEVGPTNSPAASFSDPYTLAATAVSGRTTALAAVTSTCHTGGCTTIYAGTANGGLWKTTNGGQTWAPLLDHQLSTAVGVVTIDPVNSNIVYVGLGEPNFSGDSNHGTGVLRTTDGGASWQTLGSSQFTNRAVSAILIDPTHAGNPATTRLFVSTASAVSGGATTGGTATNPYLPARGFFSSTNGGQTWTHTYPSDTPPAFPGGLANAAIHSMVMDPTNPNVLFAAYSFAGVYRTTDAGAHWTAMPTGTPGTGTTVLPVYSDGRPFDRITLAIAPANHNVLYASYDRYSLGKVNYRQYMYRTTNATDATPSFTWLNNTPDACDTQCWYDMPVTVDPNDATGNTVYAGGQANYYGYLFFGYVDAYPCSTLAPSFYAGCHTTLMKSTDGGTSWADVAENATNPGTGNVGPLHPDDHVILVNPADSNTVYTGNDGGIFVSTDATATWRDLNHGLGTLQFVGIAVGPTGAVYGGTQDNGTFRVDPNAGGVGVHVNNGDGGQPLADPSNPNIAYYATTGGSMLRDENALGPNVDSNGIPHWYPTINISGFWNESSQFYAPRAIAPSEPNIIFAGTNRILRTTTRGGTDGNGDTDTTNDPSDNGGLPNGNPSWLPLSAASTSGTCNGTFGCGNIASIAVSPTNANVVAVGTTRGQIYVTNNAKATPTYTGNCDTRYAAHNTMHCTYTGGITWTRVDTNGALPNRYPTAIKFAPGSASALYVTYSGFSVTTPNQPGHVFATTDLGAHWTNTDGHTSKVNSLPDLPFNDIVVNSTNGHLYAAADFGVFFSANNGHTWVRKDHNLPNSPVYSLAYDASTNSLFAGTHGRGIWKSDAP